MDDYCVCCGVYVPEGRMICPGCERGSDIREPDTKAAILAYLKDYHTGHRKAVYSKELERLFAVEGRTVRNKINALRREGYPICSNRYGYYYAANQDEINATVGRLNGLVTGVSNARTGLLYSSPLDPPVNIEITVRLIGGEN